jgi:hypothetical protein
MWLYRAKLRSAGPENELYRCRSVWPFPFHNCWSGRFKSKLKRAGPKASMRAYTSSTIVRNPVRSMSRSASGCCHSTRHGRKGWPRYLGPLGTYLRLCVAESRTMKPRQRRDRMDAQPYAGWSLFVNVLVAIGTIGSVIVALFGNWIRLRLFPAKLITC